MSTQYDRYLKVTLGGQTITELNGNPDAALRVRFKVVSFTAQTPNWCQVIITNLSDASAASYLSQIKSSATLAISAGYVGSNGLIFQGQGWYGIKGRESPTDTTLQLFAKDGRLAYEYAVASKTLQAGSTPKDHVNAIVGAMSKFGVSAGYMPQLSSPRSYPRGVALFGMARDLLRTIANTNNCLWSIQNGQVQMTPIGGGVPGGAITLNANTGMIGMPTQTPNGIMVRCLINPAINLGSGSLILLNNADIQLSQLSPQYGTDAVNASLQSAINADGKYRIYHIEITADSRGNDWYQDLTCFNAEMPPPNAPSDLLAAQPNTGGN